MELPYSLPLPSLRPPAAEQHPPCLWALSSFSASLQNTAYPWAQTSPSLLPVHWKWFETLCWETAPWGAEIGEWRTTKNESSVQQETRISMHSFLTLCQSFLPLANIKVTCAPSLPSSSLLGFPGDRLLTEALQGQLSSFGPEAAKKEDSTIWKYHLLTWNRKSSGTHRLADWLRPSQVTRAGLLNDTHASELCYDWVFFFQLSKQNTRYLLSQTWRYEKCRVCLWGLHSLLVSFLGEMGLSHGSAETCMLHFLSVQIQNNSAGGNAPGNLDKSVLRADAFFYSMMLYCKAITSIADLYTHTSSIELWNKVALKDVEGAPSWTGAGLHSLQCFPQQCTAATLCCLLLHTNCRVTLDNFSFHIKVETNRI